MTVVIPRREFSATGAVDAHGAQLPISMKTGEQCANEHDDGGPENAPDVHGFDRQFLFRRLAKSPKSSSACKKRYDRPMQPMNVSELMQPQARALADPSRFKLFQYIAEATAPVGVAELTDFLGFNHNAIRQHLAVLVDAGVVAESNEQRTTRGRPRKQYVLRDDALNAFGSVSGSYQRLAELLLEVIGSDASPFEVGFQVGVDAAGAGGDDVDLAEVERQLFDRLQVDGFEPRASNDGVIELSNCPFVDVVTQNSSVVCELHKGLIGGFVSSQNGELSGELTPENPNQAACRVVVVPASSGGSVGA